MNVRIDLGRVGRWISGPQFHRLHHTPEHGNFFVSSRRRHTNSLRDWSSDVCSSDLYHLFQPLLYRADRSSNVRWGQCCGSDLIKERLKKVIIGSIDDGEVNALASQFLCSLEPEIGRASCRERVEMSVVGGAFQEQR